MYFLRSMSDSNYHYYEGLSIFMCFVRIVHKIKTWKWEDVTAKFISEINQLIWILSRH